MSGTLLPHGLYSPWNSPGQNTGVGSHSLLQGIFPTLGLNPGLLHCRQILYQLSHKGSPYYLVGPNVIMSPEESESEIFKDITVLALKMEGTVRQRMWAASRNWKSQGNIFFPRATSQLHGHLDFSLANPRQNSNL